MNALFSVWVGGVEVNDQLLSKDNAQRLADGFISDGYDDVKLEEVKAAQQPIAETIYLDGNTYHPARLKHLPKGEFFVRKAGAKRVYRRGDYDRSSNMYSCTDDMDFNQEIFLSGDAIVFIGFTY